MARRRLKITYGTYVLGSGQANRHQTGPIFTRDDPDSFECRFELVVAGDGLTDAEFQTELDAARTAFRNPRQDLTVELVDADVPATVQVTLFQALTSTGDALRVFPEISQPQVEEGNTGKSAAFEVTIRGERPATYAADRLRFGFSFTVDRPASTRVRTLTVNGKFTSGLGSGARDNYLNSIAARVLTITATLGGTWQPVPDTENYKSLDDETVEFTRTFQELIHKQSLGLLNDPSIVNQTLFIDAEQVGVVGDLTERPFQRVVATYTAVIDPDISPDPEALWNSKIRDWVFQNVQDAAASSQIAEIRSRPTFDPVTNTLRATIEALVVDGGTLLFRSVQTRDEIIFNKAIRRYWPKDPPPEDSSPTPAQVYFGSKAILRTVTTRTRVVGAGDPPAIGSGAVGAGTAQTGAGRLSGFGIGQSLEFTQGTTTGGAFLAFGQGTNGGQEVPEANIDDGGVLMRRVRDFLSRPEGIAPNQVDTTERTVVEVFQIVAPPPTTSQGGGQATVGGAEEAPAGTNIGSTMART